MEWDSLRDIVVKSMIVSLWECWRSPIEGCSDLSPEQGFCQSEAGMVQGNGAGQGFAEKGQVEA